MVSKRRNDNRDDRRRPPKRAPQIFRQPSRVSIVCEEEVSERAYFESHQHHVRNPRIHVELPDEPGVPLTVVETAARRRREVNAEAEREGDENLRFDAVRAVFDVDAHPKLRRRSRWLGHRRSTSPSRTFASSFGRCATSKSREPILNDELVSRLRKHCPGDDERLPFDTLVPHHDLASQRARGLHSTAIVPPPAPRSPCATDDATLARRRRYAGAEM